MRGTPVSRVQELRRQGVDLPKLAQALSWGLPGVRRSSIWHSAI